MPTILEHAPQVRFSRLTTYVVPILPLSSSDVTLGARKTAQEAVCAHLLAACDAVLRVPMGGEGRIWQGYGGFPPCSIALALLRASRVRSVSPAPVWNTHAVRPYRPTSCAKARSSRGTSVPKRSTLLSCSSAVPPPPCVAGVPALVAAPMVRRRSPCRQNGPNRVPPVPVVRGRGDPCKDTIPPLTHVEQLDDSARVAFGQ